MFSALVIDLCSILSALNVIWNVTWLAFSDLGIDLTLSHTWISITSLRSPSTCVVYCRLTIPFLNVPSDHQMTNVMTATRVFIAGARRCVFVFETVTPWENVFLVVKLAAGHRALCIRFRARVSRVSMTTYLRTNGPHSTGVTIPRQAPASRLSAVLTIVKR